MDPRVLKAASEVTTRNLAKITLLGDPTAVTAEAKKLGADITQCKIIDPKVGLLILTSYSLQINTPFDGSMMCACFAAALIKCYASAACNLISTAMRVSSTAGWPHCCDC